ncbi:YtxH domain-containing protein [Flavobacterium sp.]|uniref:YtxH domain-containing protein n=1 Tax=Flavobacterium sp. TaxID=239 RepID=UPI003750D1BE
MKNSNVVLGILGGAAVGALLGVLFAPAKGSETRKKIRDKGSDLKDSAINFSDKVASFKNGAKVLIEEEKANIENLKDINKASLL